MDQNDNSEQNLDKIAVSLTMNAPSHIVLYIEGDVRIVTDGI